MLSPGVSDGGIAMSAWSKRISRYCFMALAAPLVLSLPARRRINSNLHRRRNHSRSSNL